MIGSNVLFYECISLLNYILREPKFHYYLNCYRLGCVVFIRIPMGVFYYFYYFPYIMFKNNDNNYLWYFQQTFGLFLLYDAYLLKQLFKNIQLSNKIKNTYYKT